MVHQQLNRCVHPLRVLKLALSVAVVTCVVASIGCGTTTKRSGTEQLLISEAVDNAVAKLNFHELNGHKVYFDTTFLSKVRSDNFVSSDYVISAIRQQLTAAGALVQDSRQDATTIVEARVGALGTDGHEITYGIPKTGGLSAAASVLSSSPIASIPEVSFAQTNAQAGVAKVIVFAYDQETKEPIWQSGVARAESSCTHSWVLGAGPFQKGSIYEGERFAGKEIGKNKVLGGSLWTKKENNTIKEPNQLSFKDTYSFQRNAAENSPVQLASAESDVADGEGNSDAGAVAKIGIVDEESK